MRLQNSLESMKSSEERIAAVTEFLEETGQKMTNPDTNHKMFVLTKAALNTCRASYKENMFDNEDFHDTGYMIVNEPGRRGWRLLTVACEIEDYPLIEFLLDQGANRTAGYSDGDIPSALSIKKSDKGVIDRTMQYISQKPPLPDFYWAARVIKN